jgi:hypothetical protein
MGQLREIYGARLSDPRTVRDLIVALPGPGGAQTGQPAEREQIVEERR